MRCVGSSDAYATASPRAAAGSRIAASRSAPNASLGVAAAFANEGRNVRSELDTAIRITVSGSQENPKNHRRRRLCARMGDGYDAARAMATDEAFIRQYNGFVRSVVLQTRRQIDVDVDLDDLLAYGFEGLLDARRRFEPERGVKFRSYAYYRVRGAVIDGIRAMMPMPRRAHDRMKAAIALDSVGEDVQDAGAGTERPAVAEAVRQVDAILGSMAAAYCVASAADPDDVETPELAAVDKERRERTRAAIATLPEREAALIRGHYLEGRSFDSIAAELGLSKSWASRLHSRALKTLCEALKPHEG